MSSASPAQGLQTPIGASQDPKIQHTFDGDVKILNGTFDSRTDIRKSLSTLQQQLQRLVDRNVQIVADIKLRIAGPEPKEHTYAVTVNDSKLDVDTFVKQFPSTAKSPAKAPGAASPVAEHMNGQRGSSARPGSRVAEDDDDDDVIEVRPPKRPRTEADDGTISGQLRETLSLLRRHMSSSSSNETLEFMKQWHTKWVKQGGWLFDTLNKAEKTAKENQANSMARLSSVQDILGNSINTMSTSTAELTNLAKLVPWLEHCRKTGADKVQAREEKWRTSSATFHDQNRRDRENAEKRLEGELQKQRALLVKIAEANGVDVEEDDSEGNGAEKVGERETREASLGAQLTAELNQEISRAGKDAQERPVQQDGDPGEKRRETISIDDDDNR